MTSTSLLRAFVAINLPWAIGYAIGLCSWEACGWVSAACALTALVLVARTGLRK